MHQAVPVQELPNGKFIYEDCGGTFSHQHPREGWWCEKHNSKAEALECYHRLDSTEELKPPTS